MSNSPYVSIKKVIDTDQERVIDFRHIKNFDVPSVPLVGWTSINNHEGKAYIDLTINGIKKNHLVFLVFKRNSNPQADKENFSSCRVENDNIVRVFAKQPLTGIAPVLSAVFAVELTGVPALEKLVGFTNGGASTSLVDVAFDGNAFVSYLNALNELGDDVLQINGFIESLGRAIQTSSLTADFIKAGQITTDKITIRSSNRINDFDSFETMGIGTTSVPKYKISGTPDPVVEITEEESFHGARSLKIINPSQSVKYVINPSQAHIDGWIKLDPGTYIFSFYYRAVSSSGALNVGIRTAPGPDVGNITITSSSPNIWRRAFSIVNIAARADYTIYFSSTSAGTYYVDAMMIERVSDEELAKNNPLQPSAFSGGGTVVIDGGNIKANSLDADKIVTNSITTDQIAANAIEAVNINAEAITAEKIAANAITTTHIDAKAITAEKIDANAITSDKIEAGAITTGKIAANAVIAGNILAEAITTEKIATNAVVADKIATNAITATKIAADAVEADKIAANAITATKIAADAVEADKIAANAITTTKIAANAIEADKIAANAITTTKIAANAVEADKIAANAITTEKIAANQITADKFNSNLAFIEKTLQVGSDLDKIIITSVNKPKIYQGTGNHGSEDTGFYIDSDGKFSLSNQLIFTPSQGDGEFAELEVNGKIRGIIESLKEIPNNRTSTAISSVVVSGDNATVNTINNHLFLVGEKILIENVVNTIHPINGLYEITSIPSTTSFTISVVGRGVSSGTYNTGADRTASLQEVTMGLHPQSGTGTWQHSPGSGLKLNKYNWWLTNNQFRVGNASSYIKWNGSTLDVAGGNTNKLKMGVGSLNSDTYYAITSAAAPAYANVNTPFYAGADGKFSISDKLTWDGSELNITGRIKQTSIIETPAGSFSPTDTLDYSLNVSGGTRSHIYDANGSNPTPVSAFSVLPKIGGTNWTSDKMTVSWGAFGALSGSNSNSFTFTPTIGSFTTNSTFVTITANFYSSSSKTTLLKTVVETIPISATKIGSTGATGATGVGITSTVISYAQGDNAIDIPSVGDWSSGIPDLEEGKFLWTRTVINYSNSTSSTSYSISRQGVDGIGTTGQSGASSVSIFISNENHVLSADYSGNLLSGQELNSYFSIFYGPELLSPMSGLPSITSPTIDKTYNITVGNLSNINGVLSIGPNGVPVYELTQISSDNGSATFTIEVLADNYNFIFSKTINYIKVKDGKFGPGLVFRGLHSVSNEYYFNDARRDVVLYNETYYIAKQNSSGIFNISNWEPFGAEFTSVATDLLLTRDASIQKVLTIGTNTNGSNANIIIDGETTNPYISISQEKIGVGNAGIFIGNTGFSIGDSSSYLKWIKEEENAVLEISGNVKIGAKTASEINNFLNTAGENLEVLNATENKINNTFDFGSNGLKITATPEDTTAPVASLFLSGNSIDFKIQDDTRAQITANGMSIETATIENSITIGRHKIYKHMNTANNKEITIWAWIGG